MHIFESQRSSPFEHLNNRLMSIQNDNQVRHGHYLPIHESDDIDRSVGRVVNSPQEALGGVGGEAQMSPFQRLVASMVGENRDQDGLNLEESLRLLQNQMGLGEADDEFLPDDEFEGSVDSEETLPDTVHYQFSSQEVNSPRHMFRYPVESADRDMGSEADMLMRFDDGSIDGIQLDTQFDYKDEYSPGDKWNKFEIEFPFARSYPHQKLGYFGVEDDGVSVWLLLVAVVLTVTVLMLIMCLSVQLINKGIRRHNQNKKLQQKMEDYFVEASIAESGTPSGDFKKLPLIRSISSSFVVPEKARNILLDGNKKGRPSTRTSSIESDDQCRCIRQ